MDSEGGIDERWGESPRRMAPFYAFQANSERPRSKAEIDEMSAIRPVFFQEYSVSKSRYNASLGVASFSLISWCRRVIFKKLLNSGDGVRVRVNSESNSFIVTSPEPEPGIFVEANRKLHGAGNKAGGCLEPPFVALQLEGNDFECIRSSPGFMVMDQSAASLEPTEFRDAPPHFGREEEVVHDTSSPDTLLLQQSS
ncbi:hypothetical protein SCHPADRAFT_891223 [Schizopora paradoxa]|uniref:Uncharacterized protein n=1 Tax=Schizopora paradoxa TaxID=27342 RepID=A0A0H2RJD2_9AGAM|nr:hypothetical protein SCHPADRAFT_891223 [Schizopora paradoxa]